MATRSAKCCDGPRSEPSGWTYGIGLSFANIPTSDDAPPEREATPTLHAQRHYRGDTQIARKAELNGAKPKTQKPR
jgi:hypothetical protein